MLRWDKTPAWLPSPSAGWVCRTGESSWEAGVGEARDCIPPCGGGDTVRSSIPTAVTLTAGISHRLRSCLLLGLVWGRRGANTCLWPCRDWLIFEFCWNVCLHQKKMWARNNYCVICLLFLKVQVCANCYKLVNMHLYTICFDLFVLCWAVLLRTKGSQTVIMCILPPSLLCTHTNCIFCFRSGKFGSQVQQLKWWFYHVLLAQEAYF